MKKTKICVTENATYDLENWNLPARSAFSQEEINALSNWVAGWGEFISRNGPYAFSAQLLGIKSEKRGMNHPGATQNAQFLLTIAHWLDCKL